MKNTIRAALAISILSTGVAFAQTLSIEDLQARIDQRIQALNPYEELLQNPDPVRSMAAMEVMLESGDEDLQRMALEYGLLSPNPQVKRAAFEAFVKTGPILSFKMEGGASEDKDYVRMLRNYFDATVDPDRNAYWTSKVGDFDDEQGCYLHHGESRCFITSNADGIFVKTSYMSARGVVNDSGLLTGTSSISDVDEPIPFSVQLID